MRHNRARDISQRLALCLFLLSFSGCVIGGEPPGPPEIPIVAPVVVTPLVVPDPPPPAPEPEPVFNFTLGPQRIAAPPAETSKPAPIVAPEPGKRGAKSGPAVPAQNPAQLIEEANKTARLGVSARGYFGGGGTHRYQWTPGRIYDVYLTSTSGTRITFPPGEILAHELVLNPDSFDVSSATIGTELSKTTVLFIRPCSEGESGCKPVASVDVALVSESGRSYDLHLIVGKVGMVGVTWAIAPIPQLQLEEGPPLAGAAR